MSEPQSHGSNFDPYQPRWFAVYTRYNREKLIFQNLSEKGIEAFLPLQRFTRRYERKVRNVAIPLISCYVFVRITKNNYIQVLDTPDVIDFVKFSNRMVAIPDKEINLLRRIVEVGEDVEIEPAHFRVGEEVEIASGKLAGIRGVLLDNQGKNLVVELNSIGYSLRIQVNPVYLRKPLKVG